MNRRKLPKPKDPVERSIFELVEILADLVDNADSRHWSEEDSVTLRKGLSNLMKAKL